MKNKVILGYIIMTILSALTACGDVNIQGEINYNDGNGGEVSDSNLYAGTCGTWDIAGKYEEGYVNGRCQMHLECGATFEFEQSDFLEGDFHVTQSLYGQWVYERGSSCGFEALDPYDMCEVKDHGATVQVDCANVSLDLTRIQ